MINGIKIYLRIKSNNDNYNCEKKLFDINDNNICTYWYNNIKYSGCFDKIFKDDNNLKLFEYFKLNIDSFLKYESIGFIGYGISGSGKTHTLVGHKDNNEIGLLPLILEYIIQHKSDNDLLYINAFQIYNEFIYDLSINKMNNLKIKEKNNFFYINNLNNLLINEYNYVDILSNIINNRIIKETHNNKLSSRSHTVYNIILKNKSSSKTSKLWIYDLAGSERYNKLIKYSKPELTELLSINHSMALLKLLFINNYNSKNTNFRYTKITKIMKECLTTCNINIILCCTNKAKEFENNINTIKFGSVLKNIKIKKVNNAIINNDSEYKDTILKLNNEIEYLKSILNIKNKNGLSDIIYKMKLLESENKQLKQKIKNNKRLCDTNFDTDNIINNCNNNPVVNYTRITNNVTYKNKINSNSVKILNYKLKRNEKNNYYQSISAKNKTINNKKQQFYKTYINDKNKLLQSLRKNQISILKNIKSFK